MKAEEEVHYEQQMKKEILIQKKHAIMEKAETKKYMQLEEQYVCNIYFQTVKNFINYCLYIFIVNIQ